MRDFTISATHNIEDDEDFFHVSVEFEPIGGGEEGQPSEDDQDFSDIESMAKFIKRTVDGFVNEFPRGRTHRY